MKTLTKLALVSAMTLSGHAMALESLDDEALSSATGQDGITISITGDITMDYMAVVDRDGLTPAGYGITTPEAGAIVVGDASNGLAIRPDAGGIKLVIDADGNAGVPVLNINADLGDTVVEGVNLAVASVGGDNTGATIANRAEVLSLGNIELNGLTANIQLGNQAQGAMINVQSTITGGLTLSDFALKGTNGDIGFGAVTITDNADTNLTLDLDIDPTATGLSITGINNMDIAASNLRFGDTNAAALGALYISNLSVGDVTISGH